MPREMEESQRLIGGKPGVLMLRTNVYHSTGDPAELSEDEGPRACLLALVPWRAVATSARAAGAEWPDEGKKGSQHGVASTWEVWR